MSKRYTTSRSVSFRAGGVVCASVTLLTASCGGEPEVREQITDGAESSSALRVRVESDLEFERMNAYVNNQYPQSSVRRSFRLPSGAPVDCVDIHAQPGLRRPGMEDHVIAHPPPEPALPRGAIREQQSSDGLEAFLGAGIEDAEGIVMSCPDGTIPIRRVTLEDAMRFRSIDDMMRKYSLDLGGDAARDPSRGHLFLGSPAASGSTYEPPGLPGPSSLHQYAHAGQYNLFNLGAHAIINIWNPNVQVPSEFSLGQIWVVGGSGGGLQTLEAGIQKYPNLYGDWIPHLFIYSTSDGYAQAGCYNLACGRFVQTNNTWVIGGGLSTSSTPGGTQYSIELEWFLSGGNWWFKVDGTWIGYYPGNLFNAAGVANGANSIDFGGEIIDDRTKHAGHTSTAMGSGAYPSAGDLQAAYQRSLWYHPNTSEAYWATGINAMRDNASCYDIAKFDNNPSWGTYIYYGGPGYNANCE